MLVPVQTVAIALTGWLLFLGLTLWLVLVPVARRLVVLVPVRGEKSTVVVSQIGQWFLPSHWHPWLTARRGTSYDVPARIAVRSRQRRLPIT